MRSCTLLRPAFTFLLFLLILPCLSLAEPVTRDDFLLQTTDFDHSFEWFQYPWAQLDQEGNIRQTYLVDTIDDDPGYETAYIGLFLRYDQQGNLSMPPVQYTPHIADDTLWEPGGVQRLRLNNNGSSVVINGANDYSEIPWVRRNQIHLFDPFGNEMIAPRNVFSEQPAYSYDSSTGLHVYNGLPRGSINSSNTIAAAWRNFIWTEFRSSPNWWDSVFARCYYPDGDSVSPIIRPYLLPLPPMDSALLVKGMAVHNNTPTALIADDGSIVVAWIACVYATHYPYACSLCCV